MSLPVDHLLQGLAAPVTLGVLCALFVAAGLEKLADRDRFFTLLLQVPGVPHWGARPLSVLLPWLEVVLAAAAIVGQWRWALLALALLNVGFAAVLAQLLARGSRVSCGCFGELSNEPVSRGDVFKNLLMAALFSVLAAGPVVAAPSPLHVAAMALGVAATAIFLAGRRLRHSGRNLRF